MTANNPVSVSADKNYSIQSRIDDAVNEIGKIVLGKDKQVRLSLCCMFAGGHLLMEDKPGMGKTTLSQALATVMGLAFSRIQFTSDLLPADILGVSVYEQKNARFSFHPGPIFNNLILADEINRTTPKTQSALLEAMEEGQVSVDGETRILPDPFFVIATQNPTTFAGTYPLPESQLDRFLMCLKIGYPDPDAERALLMQTGKRADPADLKQCLNIDDIKLIHARIAEVKATDSLLDYIQRLIAYTRQDDKFAFGLSPRGGMALIRAARTWAVMNDRNHVLPEDVQTVLPAVADHRLRSLSDASGRHGEENSQHLLNEVDIIS